MSENNNLLYAATRLSDFISGFVSHIYATDRDLFLMALVAYVSQLDGHKTSFDEQIYRTRLSTSAVKRKFRMLTDAGIFTEHTDPADNRRKLYELTPQARREFDFLFADMMTGRPDEVHEGPSDRQSNTGRTGPLQR